MPLSSFNTLSWNSKKEHSQYQNSILMPVAPEWTVGEVLVAAAYRSLVLGYPEGEVDRADITDYLLPTLEPREMWRDLLTQPGALVSPRPARERLGLKQLMPLVPEMALYAGALGKKRKGRWKPGNLLVSSIQTGTGLTSWRDELNQLAMALTVGPNDDLFAQFVENELRKVRKPTIHLELERPKLYAPAWRVYNGGQHTPSERFVKDLRCVINLKDVLTRRQWTVMLESLFRLALAMHMMWICRLNETVWNLVLGALETGHRPSPSDVETQCWLGHGTADPLLELGSDCGRMIKQRIRRYAHARIGLNVVLHALDDVLGPNWESSLEFCEEDVQPSQRISEFVSYVAEHADSILRELQSQLNSTSVNQFVGKVADANPKFLRGDSGGVTKNLVEFLSHTLVAMNVGKEDVELASYDQAYVAVRQRGKALNAPKYVRPGPATLILLVHACCTSQRNIPASMEDFRDYLLDYGITAPSGELVAGPTGRNMESLGLVVDSPDAGGGRLLVNPF